jgi:hypothetical protein
MGETQFTDKVIVSCLPLFIEKDAFVAWMTDLTQGQAMIDFGSALYKEHPIAKG